MTNFSSESLERKLLSFFMIPPLHLKLLATNLDMFSHKVHRQLAEVLKGFVAKYKNPPGGKDDLIIFCNEIAKTTEDVDAYSEVILLLDSLPNVKAHEFDFCYNKAVDYMIGRGLFDVAENFKSSIEDRDEANFSDLRQNMINGLLALGNTSAAGAVKRGYIYESVEDRWSAYMNRQRGTDDNTIVPFGMKSIDDSIGGMRKTFLSMVYSKTGGGKTRFSINVAHNAAAAGYNVVYFSLEMAFDLLATCLDSRMAWVDSHSIMFGKLDKSDRRKFKEALLKQYREKLNIWIVDIPLGARSVHILEELEMYKAITGKEPDLVIIDYANLVEPMVKYTGRSEKYDFLFKEFHEIARMHGVGLLTAAQEKRERTVADKQKKKQNMDDDTEGAENIGLSNYIAPHCENVIRLKQNKFDSLQNRLWAIFDKCRYGKTSDMVPLLALWDKGYIGDRLVSGTGLRIQKQNA